MTGKDANSKPNNSIVSLSRDVYNSSKRFEGIELIKMSSFRSLSVDSLRILYFALNKISTAPIKDKESVFDNPIFIPIKEIASELGIRIDGLYKKIKDSCSILMALYLYSKSIEEGSESFKMTSVVDECIYTVINGESGVLISLSPKIKKMVIVEKNFTKFNLSSLVQLSFKYSSTLYTYLKGNYEHHGKYKGFMDVTIDDLRELLDVQNVKIYSEFAQFFRRVINPSIKEINSKTEIVINLTQVKTGRRVSHLRFTIFEKNGINKEGSKSDSIVSSNSKNLNIKTKLEDIGCETKFINHLLKNYELDFIEFLISKVEERNPENKGAYLNFLSSEPSIKNEFDTLQADNAELERKKSIGIDFKSPDKRKNVNLNNPDELERILAEGRAKILGKKVL